VTEIQRYQVLSQFEGFELRRYEPYAAVSVDASGDLAEAGNRGFSPLFAFIAGANANQQKIAMTSPVIEVPQSNGYQISFVMPAGTSASAVPAPKDSALRVREVPATLIAARRFSGVADESKFQKRGRELSDAVIAAGLSPLGEVFYARYNGPFTPGPLRRNEALVEVLPPKGGSTEAEKLDN
jgi:hypothetical protein